MPYAPQTIARAERILDGIKTISKAEMLVHGEYISSIRRPERANAICGGRQACLVGSFALAAEKGNYGGADSLVDAIIGSRYDCGRAEFLASVARKPHVRIAFEAMEKEAKRLLDKARKTGSRKERDRATGAREWGIVSEGYFELYLDDADQATTHKAILALCNGAKRHVRKQAR